MLLKTLQTHRDEILRLSERFGARHLRVFGSVARGDDGPASDVDLLVELPRGYDLFAQRLPLVRSLEELLSRRVELIPERELNPHIRERVLAEAVEL